jgi:hypothetical protein
VLVVPNKMKPYFSISCFPVAAHGHLTSLLKQLTLEQADTSSNRQSSAPARPCPSEGGSRSASCSSRSVALSERRRVPSQSTRAPPSLTPGEAAEEGETRPLVGWLESGESCEAGRDGEIGTAHDDASVSSAGGRRRREL